MNWLDIVLILIIAIPAVIGVWRGLLKTVVPLIGIVLGVYLAGQFYSPVANWLSVWLESPAQSKIVAFLIIFVVVLLITMVVAWQLRKVLNILLLGWIDHIGGLVFGLAIGAIISGVVVLLFARFPFAGVEAIIQDSALAVFLLDKFPFVLGLLPEEFDAVRQFFQ